MSDGYFENPFFTWEELRCRGSGMLRLHDGFLRELIALRQDWNMPMFVRSACRSAQHNAAVGGAPNSTHICNVPALPAQMGCMAVDIGVISGEVAMRLAKLAANRAPWSIGVSTRGFLHLDARWLIGQPPVLFGY